MHDVHARKERKLIILNSQNQPVGPTDSVAIELSSFLGTLARNATLCPFDIFDWKRMDTKKDLWDYTKVWSFQYLISCKLFYFNWRTKWFRILGEIHYSWSCKRLGFGKNSRFWRRNRSDLKINYYAPYDDEIHMESLVIFQNVNLQSSSNIGILKNSR